MLLSVTNISAAPVHLGDLYISLQPGATLSTSRSASEVTAMSSLLKAMAAGLVAVTLTPDAAEIASGVLTPPMSVQAADMAPAAVAEIASGLVVLRREFPPGAGGAPDDVEVFPEGGLPFRFRVIDAWAMISAGVPASSVSARTRPGGEGILLAGPLDSSGGVSRMSGPLASAAAVPGPAAGMFIRRGDSGAGGELFVLVRRES